MIFSSLLRCKIEDPITAELPSNQEELDDFLENDYVYDMDEDGNPGITIVSTGALEANLFNFSRIIRQIEGISLSADKLVGLMTTDRYTYVMVSDNPLMKPGRKYMPQHDDPKENWFEEIRVDDRQTCDNVMTFKEEGRILSREALLNETIAPPRIGIFALGANGQETENAPEKPFAPLRGTFALKVVTTGKVDLPLVGEKTLKGHILFFCLPENGTTKKGILHAQSPYV